MKIAVCVIATNGYFLLGCRFIRRFSHFYSGKNDIHYYMFTDTDPTWYLMNVKNLHYTQIHHTTWEESTNSKFSNILQLGKKQIDHVYYFDADTNIVKPFDDDWFITNEGLSGAQHFSDTTVMQYEKDYDRNPASMAYIPTDTPLPQMYYHGAFFGGTTQQVMFFCETLCVWQQTDKQIPYEPRWNDESYINKYFHNHPPSKSILLHDFPFLISDKGGLENLRDVNNRYYIQMKNQLYHNGAVLFDIRDGHIVFCN